LLPPKFVTCYFLRKEVTVTNNILGIVTGFVTSNKLINHINLYLFSAQVLDLQANLALFG